MPDVTLHAHTDTWVDHSTQNSNHGSGVKLRVRADTTNLGRYALIFFARPFAHGATISSAALRIYAHHDWGAGSRTITARRITESWKENRVTWSNKPASSATNAGTVTVSAPQDQEEISIDVTDLIQDVSDGDDWHGLELRLSTDEARSFYSSDTPVDGVRPKLDVSWGGAPYPPSNLHPASGNAISVAGPKLTWRFTDHRGDTEQANSQVQVSTSSDFSAPAYDSTKTANTKHSWNLAGLYTVPDGATRWWRVKVWDGDDNASGWSDAVSFQRQSKGTLTIVNPPASPLNIVDETTPPFSWTFTGRTQEQVQLYLLRVYASGTTKLLWQFPRQKTTITSINPDHGLIKTGETYRIQLFVWDTLDRESIPGDWSFEYAQRDFTYERDGTPDPVDTLTAELFGAGVVLTWTRAVEPDWFSLRVGETDGGTLQEEVQRLDPEDVRVSGSTYQYIWWRATPGTDYTYEVEAVVTSGGVRQHSDNNPTDTATTQPSGFWFINEDDDDAIRVVGPESPELMIGDSGTTYDLVGRRDPVRISDAIRGYEGGISGMLLSSASRDTLLAFKGELTTLRFVVDDINIPVVVEEVSVVPRLEESMWDCSVSFFQVDEFFDISGV